MASVTYRGRYERNEWIVEVLSEPCPPFEIVRIEPLKHVYVHCIPGSSFSWGYGGSGPADLALSLLAHHYGETAEQIQTYYYRLDDDVERSLAWKYHQDFKWRTVATWNQNGSWHITTEEVDRVVAAIDKESCEIAEDREVDEHGK